MLQVKLLIITVGMNAAQFGLGHEDALGFLPVFVGSVIVVGIEVLQGRLSNSSYGSIITVTLL